MAGHICSSLHISYSSFILTLCIRRVVSGCILNSIYQFGKHVSTQTYHFVGQGSSTWLRGGHIYDFASSYT